MTSSRCSIFVSTIYKVYVMTWLVVVQSKVQAVRCYMFPVIINEM